MQSHPIRPTYRPGRDGMSGRRGAQARELRALIAANSADRRGTRRPEFIRLERDEAGCGWICQLITPYAVDGIHPDAPHHRMFGPREARADRRALAGDCTSRAMHLDAASDRILARALSVLNETAAQHERTMHDAYLYQLARAADHRATHQRIAMHEQIDRAAALAGSRR